MMTKGTCCSRAVAPTATLSISSPTAPVAAATSPFSQARQRTRGTVTNRPAWAVTFIPYAALIAGALYFGVHATALSGYSNQTLYIYVIAVVTITYFGIS